MKATFRPLRWIGAQTPANQRRSRWTFKATYSDTLNLLELELEKLGATELVLEADFREQDIRIDGQVRANARQPDFPGVRIAFESRHGPLVYQTDAYEFWQHNVRAIALSLQALRAVDRYGVTKRAEQYTGWRAIEAGPVDVPLTAAAARELLLTLLSEQDSDDSDRALYRRAVKVAHPDKGGTRQDWTMLQEAKRVLGF